MLTKGKFPAKLENELATHNLCYLQVTSFINSVNNTYGRPR